MNIWGICQGYQRISTLQTDCWRAVEAQHIATTRDLVDTLAEQEILEDLIEESKPAINKNLHYLLATPFRYPPLHYGSRFGSAQERSLWYGSKKLEVTFAEVSYYRFLFLSHTNADLGYINNYYTAFKANISTKQGLNLTQNPFNKFRDRISSPTSYADSQLLGSAMRSHSVEAFLFYSARFTHDGVNVGLFSSKAFKFKQPNLLQIWQCTTTKTFVEFRHEVLRGLKKYVYKSSDVNFYA